MLQVLLRYYLFESGLDSAEHLIDTVNGNLDQKLDVFFNKKKT